MTSPWRDLRLAGRFLWRDRSFTATAVSTLTLCLAANIAMFAVVDTVLLKPLPFPEPHRLVKIFNQYPGAGVEVASNGVPDYFDRLRDLRVVTPLAAYRQTGVTVGGAGREATRIQSLIVTPSFLAIVGARAHRGRLFTEEEGVVGQEKKVLLSHGYWQRAMGADDAAVGAALRLGGEPYLIVGVLTDDFRFLDPEIELILPAAFTADERSDNARHSNNWQQIGRLGPDATIEQAQSQLDAINAANDARFPHFREILKNAGFRTRVARFQDDLVRDIRRTLSLLWSGVFLVLVIGCVNVANLALVRASSRIRELAVRHALGASRSALAAQLLTETMLLSVAGGVLGIALGWWALGAAPLLGLDQLPRGAEIVLDGRVVAMAMVLTAIVGTATAVLPAAALARAELAQIVREEGRTGTATRGARVVRRLLVISQVALAIVLLTGAGLLLASFKRVLAIDTGFRADSVLTGTINLPASRYSDASARRLAADRILERTRALPGIAAAGVTSWLPLSGSSNDSVILAEGYRMRPGESLISPNHMAVSDGFFEAMGATLLAGRFFRPDDAADRPGVLIIDERLARKFWPDGGGAIGKRMYQPGSPENLLAAPREEDMLTVVGVVRSMRLVGMVDSATATRAGAYFFPFRQRPSSAVNLVVRTAQDPTAVTESVRRVVASIDPELPFHNVRTLQERVDAAVIDRRTPAVLASGFAMVALLLAVIGIYGVLAYQVSQRRREIGIRMALGAGRARIFRLVASEGVLIVGSGTVLGLGAALIMRRPLESQLYDVSAMDPRVLIGVSVLLAAVALTACVLPARRATRIDPVVTLAE
jgi:predicted permease